MAHIFIYWVFFALDGFYTIVLNGSNNEFIINFTAWYYFLSLAILFPQQFPTGFSEHLQFAYNFIWHAEYACIQVQTIK